MLTSETGKSTLCRAVQPKNALMPISVSESGNETVCSRVHFEKAFSATEVTPSAKATLCRLAQPASESNAPSETDTVYSVRRLPPT